MRQVRTCIIVPVVPVPPPVVIKDWDRDSGIYMDGWCTRYLPTCIIVPVVPVPPPVVIKDWDRDSGIYMDGWSARYVPVVLSLSSLSVARRHYGLGQRQRHLHGRQMRQVRTCIILTLDPCDFDTGSDPRIRNTDLRIRIFSSVAEKMVKKLLFFLHFFYFLKVQLYQSSKIKSQVKNSRNQSFFYCFACWWIMEGSVSRRPKETYESYGSGSGSTTLSRIEVPMISAEFHEFTVCHEEK